MKIVKIKILLLLLIVTAAEKSLAQNPENWTSKQLMQPAELAKILSSGKHLPIILSVGPGAMLPHSREFGMLKDKENLNKLKKELNTIPKQTKIVVYCGCCPFDHCPNIRPAIQVLKDMKFTNYMLLNLEHNIKTDWINKGYPTSE